MIRLQITDNQNKDYAVPICNCAVGKEDKEEFELNKDKVRSDLQEIANVKIGKKTEGNPNLLVFPNCLDANGDKIGEQSIIGLSDDNKISTGNIMGFVGVNQTQIDIRSRFAQTDGNDYFLHYMLQKVFAINLFDLKHDTSAERIFDFLLYLFPHFLRKAVAQGVFKKYRRFEHNDANIRGPIDVSRHIRQNIPFRGTVAYTTREHTYDNELTQLVRHTIELIRSKEQGQSILNNDADTKTAVSQIVMATPTYNARECAKIVSQNLRPVRHPYFSAYTDLQRLCLQILRHEELKYGRQKDQIYGILFDGAWLWEEYLAGVLKKCGYTHAENHTGKNPITLYNNNPRYPDYYKCKQIKDFKYGDVIPDENDVLDAKYKMLDFNSAARDDIHQIITYMHILPSKRTGLIYPSKISTIPKEFNVYGMGGTIRIIGVNVNHQAIDYKSYIAAMVNVESELANALKAKSNTQSNAE
ncbi:MAG: hypothetical protein J6W13_13595 [Salinivirgaceae bacterium]|nr:hypothetical protein [Salinivirgaceae bacterium]